jgi:hypothetical protein
MKCHNPNLGFATKARACKVVGQQGSSGVTSHVPGSAKECEGMNPHTPILGVRIPMDSQIAGVKTHWIEKLFISLKSY